MVSQAYEAICSVQNFVYESKFAKIRAGYECFFAKIRALYGHYRPLYGQRIGAGIAIFQERPYLYRRVLYTAYD